MNATPRGGVQHRCRRLARWWGGAGRLVLLVPALAVLLMLGARPASAATLEVCQHGCPYTQLVPALAAARSGDTITVGPGTYAGGVTIDVSVKLVGAGSGATIIRGGGPVLTIGVAGAPSEPTVTIEGVTVTGGVTVGNLTPFSGRGGGIYIPRAAGPSTGATVTIRNSVIRGNSVAPRVAVESDDPCCLFADSGGGGISNDGTLTLDHTRVSDNRADAASGLASNAIGGGILNRAFGNLTLKHSVVTDNHVEVTPPNGRFAPGGGIAMVAGTLTITDSLVSDNTADTSSAVPTGVEQEATAGGIQIQGNASATIRGTTITGNSVSSTNSAGDALAFSGGLHADGPIVLSDSTVSDNRVAAMTATGRADVDSGAGEINVDATISNTRFTGNSATATSSAGVAHAGAGAIVTAASDRMTISDSVISANRLTATSTTGSSTVDGGGIANIGVLTLRNTSVADNRGAASGPGGSARGGGIFNGSVPDGPPSVRLALVDSPVTRNTLTASPGITVQGGGLFTLFPVTLTSSLIAQNVPDQCYGC
jgi:Right handed beta helix region